MKSQMKISKLRMVRRGWSVRVLMALAVAGAGVAALDAGVVKIEMPAERASFKPGPEGGIANAQCLTCHSVEYVQTQPPMPLAFWSAEVKKMRDKYGASIPADQMDALAHYLAENYGTGAGGAPGAPAATEAEAQPASVQALATRYGCLSCHGVNVKIVGPAFRDVAMKYRNDPEAYQKIAAQVHGGGSGKWGPVLMPPFPMVTDAQTKMLADWILSQAGPAK
jgi:cytochrome c551/c552